MENLEAMLKEFRNITLKLIDALREEQFDNINLYLDNREKIINEINETNYDSTLFKSLAASFELLKLEDEVNRLMAEKKQSILVRIRNINKSMVANGKYANSMKNYSSYFFNKKI